MAASHSHRVLPGWLRLLPLAVALVGALLYLHRIQIDDAFITYRYAANVATLGTLAYGSSSSFASTAPGYAVLLGAFGALGLDIPTAGGVLGAAAIGLAGTFAALWLGHHDPLPGLLAGLLIAFSPLAWLVLGMEGNLAVALVLLGFLLSERGRDGGAAVAFAVATLLRFDALAAAAAWGLWMRVRHRWRALGVGALYGVLVLGGHLLLVWGFDAPLFPSTLGSKQAQQTLGISGFFPDTSWLEAIALLARAYANQTWLYIAMAAFALVGLVLTGHRTDSDRPALLLGMWALLHVLLYQLLGVTPYLWYYLPLWIAVSVLAARGTAWIVTAVRHRHAQLGLGVLGTLLLLGGPLISHARMWAHVQPGSVEPEPSLTTKVLPELKARPYRAAGEWLARHTPPDALVGVTEVGILGYYSQRPMLDFLGLLDGEVAAALARGDLSWALYTRQPDYLVLSAVNPIYGYSVYRDPWFQAAYAPVHTVPAEGFWGGNLTIYRREGFPQPSGPLSVPPPGLNHQANAVFDGSLELLGLTHAPGPWLPGQATNTVLYWRVREVPSRQYKLIFHIVDERGALVAGFDKLPLFGAPPTTQWQPGQVIADFVPVALPPIWETPMALRYELFLIDSETEEPVEMQQASGAIAAIPLYLPAPELHPAAQPLVLATPHDRDPTTLALSRFTISQAELASGSPVQLTLQVDECDCPIDITAALLDPMSWQPLWHQSQRIEQPGHHTLSIEPEPSLPPGWLPLHLTARQGERPLYRLDDAGHIVSESVPLSPLFRVP